MWRGLTRHFGWKLGSLAVAAVLWLAVEAEPEVVTTRTVPIFYSNLRKGLIIGTGTEESVRVELRGAGSKLSPANLSTLAITLDLASAGGPGERTYTLSNNDLRLPEGVTFLRAMPSQLRIRLIAQASKTVPVQVRIGAPPPGYHVVSQESDPVELKIEGPEQRVAKADHAETDTIDLSGTTQTTVFRVSAFVSDPMLSFQADPTVSVRVTIEKDGIRK